MHSSVRKVFVPFTIPIEGKVGFMYTDSGDLVTTGIGNKIDPIGQALILPWFHGSAQSVDRYTISNDPATEAEVRAEWDRVKRTNATANRWAEAKLFLRPEDVQKLVEGRMEANEAYLRKLFPAWDTWQANAQLGALSMAWAMGPGAIESQYKKFSAALRESPPNYAAAAKESRIRGDNVDASLANRNLSNLNFFLGADKAQREGRPPEDLTKSTSDIVAMASGKLGNIVRWAQAEAAADLIASQKAVAAHKGISVGVVLGVGALGAAVLYARRPHASRG